MHDMETCVRFKVPIIITSLRPPGEIIAAAHSYGGIVLHDVINVRHARKAADAGVDGLILVCAGAGGHAGTLSPFALLPEVRKFFDKTIVLAGAISNGASVLAAQAIGADLAYMGTRFIAVREANASEEYKQMIIKSAAEDIVYTALFSGINGNYLKHSVLAAGLDPDNLPPPDKNKMNFGSGRRRRAQGLARHLERGPGRGPDRRRSRHRRTGRALATRVRCRARAPRAVSPGTHARQISRLLRRACRERRNGSIRQAGEQGVLR